MGPGTGALLQGSKANRKLSMDEDEDEVKSHMSAFALQQSHTGSIQFHSVTMGHAMLAL